MPSLTVAEKLLSAHLVEGRLEPGEEIALSIDQTLTQDATGTTVMLELEAMGIERVRTELSVQYVDHNLLQADHRNADDHAYLRTACARLGIWFSPPGNGVSHPVHQQWFGKPGKTLLGADSHTPAAGALGMLGIGSGGIEVALAMAGEPLRLRMPEIWGVELRGELPPWVSAKDVILEMLRRHGVEGGVGRIIEYYGPGLRSLTAMDRHVIANMGAELGATSTVFPADEEVDRFLKFFGRGDDFVPIEADPGARYHVHEHIDLSRLEPLIAMPCSPGNVRPVREVEGCPIGQAYVGSSANPGFRDFAVAAEIVAGRKIDPAVSFDINPTSRRVLADLARSGHLHRLIEAGARIHQAGCNGCIGMGQAPATDQYSLRTVPRNFPGRSGTREDKVCLVSPETAATSALFGQITDPRSLAKSMAHPRPVAPRRLMPSLDFVRPVPARQASQVSIRKGPEIVDLPELRPLPERLEVEVLLELSDDVSTDEIMPAGTRVLPWRSNVPRLSEFVFEAIDPRYAARARTLCKKDQPHAIVAGRNYGQGSSREHAALAPRVLGLRVVLARSFARIHHQNLTSHGILPLTLPEDGLVARGDTLVLEDLPAQLRDGDGTLELHNETAGRTITATHQLTAREREIIIAGGLIPYMAARERSAA